MKNHERSELNFSEKMLAFAGQCSNFRDSFNHIKTAFRDGSIKISIFNAKFYMD